MLLIFRHNGVELERRDWVSVPRIGDFVNLRHHYRLLVDDVEWCDPARGHVMSDRPEIVISLSDVEAVRGGDSDD